MRILFMGTPDIAAESLAALLDAGHEVCGVFTRRDKPVGRKQILTAPPVKQLAVEHGLSVYQPRTLRDGSSDELIKELAPDIIVVVAYGCIIPPQLLHAAKYGCINLHVSLLPKYRGSAPIQWAVLNGDEGTGVTIMQLDEGLDTGDILMVEPVTIDPEETSGELFDRVSAVGAGTLVAALEKIEAGELTPRKQDNTAATMAPPLTKDMAQFDFTQDAAHIHNWVRGMNPWPVAWFAQDGKRIKVLESRLAENPQHTAPGTVLALKPLTIAAENGAVALLTVTPEGGKPMAGLGRGPPPESGGQPVTPRRLAVKALIHQEQAGYANLVLDAELKKCMPPLDSRDAAFAARIFYTTLERLPLLDYRINQFTKKPVAKLDAPVRAVLRAGLAQALYMNVPLPAAVNESVKLTRALGKSSAAGMVNAVLRRAAAADVSEADFADPLDRLSIYYCLSRPVAELFYAQFGAEAFPLAAAFYEKPKTTIRVNTLRTNDTDLTALLQQEGHTVTPGPWPGALVVEFAGSPAASAAFKKGLFHVQGLASQFAALCVDAQPGQQVLDLCAAPGGKSLTLAEAMQDKGQLVSGEFVPARVPLLQQAFDRCGITCAVAVENDATQHNSDWPTFDRVLCDVPCSGLGVIAKKPDIRYKDLDGIENLLAAQQKILQNGADSLAENGRLVYSTCTVNDKENQAQVEKFLSANPDFHVVLPKTAVPGADITPLGTLFLPHRTGTDGFFAAILERN